MCSYSSFLTVLIHDQEIFVLFSWFLRVNIYNHLLIFIRKFAVHSQLIQAVLVMSFTPSDNDFPKNETKGQFSIRIVIDFKSTYKK